MGNVLDEALVVSHGFPPTECEHAPGKNASKPFFGSCVKAFSLRLVSFTEKKNKKHVMVFLQDRQVFCHCKQREDIYPLLYLAV